MQPNELPIVVIPLELPAEAADTLIAFLYDLADAIERHYAPAATSTSSTRGRGKLLHLT